MNEDKGGESHHKDVDAREVPNDLKIGILPRIIFLSQDEALGSDGVTNKEKRDGEGKCFAPAPIERKSDQIMS